MTHSATYNRQAIMTAAWEIVRKANVALFGFRVIMRRALKAAWANAKHKRTMEARQEKQEQASPVVLRIQNEIAIRESKTHWEQPDYARIGKTSASFPTKKENYQYLMPSNSFSLRCRLNFGRFDLPPKFQRLANIPQQDHPQKLWIKINKPV